MILNKVPLFMRPATILLAEIGAVASLGMATIRAIRKKRPAKVPLFRQFDHVGVGSWSIAVLTAIFTGAVMALQFADGLKSYGASSYTGRIVSLGIVREMGPTLTAVLVGGRVGAGFAAELGSMSVTEQVDAIQALGADPVEKLVVPRVLACVVMIPALTILADFVGLFGGMLAVLAEVGVTPRWYLEQITDTLGMVDFNHGIIKSAFFGVFIGLIGCYKGLQTRGGTEGVGRATTTTVVAISITILVSNFILTKILMVIYG